MKFSLCLPTYKGAHVLSMVLEDIFNQAYQDFEILLGDDSRCPKITTNSKAAFPNSIIINQFTL